jgi:hypothetical protein
VSIAGTKYATVSDRYTKATGSAVPQMAYALDGFNR